MGTNEKFQEFVGINEKNPLFFSALQIQEQAIDFLSCFTVLGWQNTCESVHDITATLAALATEIDISMLYRGLDPKNVHRLVSMVLLFILMVTLV